MPGPLRTALGDRHGPGGGGGGGFVYTSGAVSGTSSVAGGANGITTTDVATQAYGATPGLPGQLVTNVTPASIPDSISGANCVPVALTTSKTTSTPAVMAGTTATYTITVSNAAGAGGASGVEISDALPAGFTYASTGAVNLSGNAVRTAITNPTAPTGTPTWGTFLIPDGGSVSITFTVNVNVATPPGTYQNPATAAFSDPVRTGSETLTSTYDPASSAGEDVTVTAPSSPGPSCGIGMAQWNFDNLTVGANTTPAYSSIAGDVSTATAQAGVGLGATPTIAAAGNPANAWTATSFGTATTLSTALNDYFQFGIDATNYTGLVLTFDANRTTPTGPGNVGGPANMAVFYTLDRTAGAPVYTQLGAAYAIPVTTYNATVFTADFSGIAGLNNNPNAGFRIYGYNAEGATGTGRLDNVTFTGCQTLLPPDISKSFSPTTITVGNTSTLTFRITNPNLSSVLNGVGFTDTYPSGLVNATPLVTANTCGGTLTATAGGNNLILYNGTIVANSYCEVSASVTSSTANTYSNTSGTVTSSNAGTGNIASATLTVTTVNDPPVANDDSANTQLNTPVTFSATGNDTDSDGTIDAATVDLDPATAGIQNTFTVAGEGTFTVDASGNVTFTPTATFTGTSSIPYTVQDNDGATSNAATLSVTVNDPPVANDDSANTQLNTPVTFSATGNDTDSDGTIDAATVDLDPATAGIQATFTVTGEGTFTVDASGNVTFTPTATFTGTSSIPYTVQDNDGATSNAATLSVTVNDPPVANDDSANTQLNTPVTFSATGNDTDSDGTIDAATVDLDPATAGIQNTFTVAGEGTFTVDASGNVTFTPTATFTGTSSIPYTVQDNDGATSNAATLSVTVNDPPVANDDSANTQLNTPVTFSATGNDTDSDGTIDAATVDLDPATAGIQNTFTVAGEGTFTVDASGNVTFTPTATFTGTSSIPYTVQDNDGATSNTATLTVTTVNDPPVANDDSANTQLNTPVTFSATGNDTDSDGTIDAATVDLDPATAGIQNTFTVAGEGTFTVDASGNVTFTPTATFTGTSSIPYTVQDNDGATSNTATLSVTVNDPPVANDDSANTQLNTPVTFSATGNDTDSDGTIDAATVDLDPATAGIQNTFTVAGEGTFTVDASGNVTFTPTATFTGTSSIPYTVQDNDGATSNAATLSVTVNDPPVANDDSANTQLNTPVTFSATGNDTDSDGTIDAATVDLDPATAGIQNTFTVAGEGTFTVDASGNVTFTPTATFTGTSSIPYTVQDNDGATSNTATLSVTVNDPPVANDDSANTQLNTPVTFSATGNDTDSDGTIDAATVDLDPATAGIQATFTVTGEGTFTVDASGNVTFTPTATFTGTSSIPYTVQDNDGATSNAATLSVTVNDPPVANDDSANTQLNTPVTFSATGNDTDSDGTIDAATVDLDPATAGIQNTFTVAGEGTFTVDASGNVTFTPTATFTGTSSIPYTVQDNDGATSNAATLSVTVNDPPVANDDSANTQLNTPVTFSATGNDTDSDGTIDAATVDLDPATAGIQNTFTVAGEGTFTVDASGNVTFTPTATFTGTSSIPYTVQDNDGATSNAATLSVTVNDPPVANDDSANTQLNTPVTFSATGNDTDSDGTIDAATVDLDPATAGIQNTFTVAGEGTFTVDASGNVTFTPTATFTGTSSIPYTVQDNDGATSNAATLSVAVNVPTATDDSANTPPNTTVTVDVTSNDNFGGDGPSNTAITITTNPTLGIAVVDNGGTPTDPTDDQITYTPNPGATGTDTITYQICDSNGDCDTALVTITLDEISDLSLTKTVDNSSPNVGDNIVFTITAINNGPSNATGVLVNDLLPVGLTYVSDNGGGTYVSATGNWTIGILNSGAPISLQITATVIQAGGITNTAQVMVSDQPDPNSTPGNNIPTEDDQASVTIGGIFDPPSAIKTFNDAGLPELEFRMVWINSSNAVAIDVQVTDQIPTGTTYVVSSLTCDPRGSSSNAAVASSPLSATAAPSSFCGYDSVANQIQWQGSIGPDNGNLTEAVAANEVVITFRVTVDGTVNQVRNQGFSRTDVDDDTNFDEETVLGSSLVGSNEVVWNRVTSDPGDPGDGPHLPRVLPATGFAPNVITALPKQSAEKIYTATDVWLEIPNLGVKVPIVGVPLVDEKWDLSWLGNQAGWLAGTAFPSWMGNSAVTGHVTLSNGKSGPFASLGSLKWGDRIIVHAYGYAYVYQVRENKTIAPNDTSVLKHEDNAWLTLITCKTYDKVKNTYANRISVRAVLLSVTEDKAGSQPSKGR